MDDHQHVNAFTGLAAQYWPTNRLMLSAGIGLGSYVSIGEYSSSYDLGLALSARAGYSVFTNKRHALRFALEATPSFYEDVRIVGCALNFEWQLF